MSPLFVSMPNYSQVWKARLLYWMKMRIIKKLKTPISLVFFITNRCNARCKHCFYWKELNKSSDEINLEEIKVFASSLKHIIHTSLTGGEPFLRSDLPEICQTFTRVNHSRSIHISTNGLLTQRIYQVCRRILTECNLSRLTIQVSLDGLEKTHDEIRGARGAFNNAIETIRKLSVLRKKYPNLEIEIATIIMRDNSHEIEKLIRFTQRFQAPHKFSIVRGAYSTFHLSPDISSGLNPQEERRTFVSEEELEQLYQRICSLNNSLRYKFLSKLQRRKLRISIDILKAKKRIIPCFAGNIDGVVYPNGDVAFCEHTIPIGNLKQTSFDFYKLWNSRNANSMRQEIKRCSCIHGCNLCTSLSVIPEVITNNFNLNREEM
jgi:MoaA/NifB/PqqE/SkfB family radical SAM enzyme